MKTLDWDSVAEHVKKRMRAIVSLHMSNYENFADIPDKHRSTAEICDWMLAKRKMLSDIPKGFRNDRIVIFALCIEKNDFADVGPDDVKRYYEICRFAVQRSGFNFTHIPVVFVTEELVSSLIGGLYCPLSAFVKKPQFHHLFTTELITQAVKENAVVLKYVWKYAKQDEISDSSIEAGLKASIYGYSAVYLADKSEVLINLLGQGYWPGHDEATAAEMRMTRTPVTKRPTTVEAVLDQWAEAKKVCQSGFWNNFQYLFVAMLSTFPREKTWPVLTTTSNGLDFLFTYSKPTDIKDLAVDHGHVRGRLLEQDLGM